MANPGKRHWVSLLNVLRYIQGTLKYGLVYNLKKESSQERTLVGYTDADYGRCLDSRKSLSGYLFLMDKCLISWRSHLQPVVALSTTEAEFMAATDCIKEALWLQGLLMELGVEAKPALILSDNQSTIHLLKNPTFHDRSTWTSI